MVSDSGRQQTACLTEAEKLRFPSANRKYSLLSSPGRLPKRGGHRVLQCDAWSIKATYVCSGSALATLLLSWIRFQAPPSALPPRDESRRFRGLIDWGPAN
jgi:hypothetical protein